MARLDDVYSIFREIEYGKDRRMCECTKYVEKTMDKFVREHGEDYAEERLQHRWERICAAMMYPDYCEEEVSGVYGEGYARLYREILIALMGYHYSVEQQIYIEPDPPKEEQNESFRDRISSFMNRHSRTATS